MIRFGVTLMGSASRNPPLRPLSNSLVGTTTDQPATSDLTVPRLTICFHLVGDDPQSHRRLPQRE